MSAASSPQLAAVPAVSPALRVTWNLGVERPTLGGALVLRQEAELAAARRGLHEVQLNVVVPAGMERPTSLLKAVFATSALSFHLSHEPALGTNWPDSRGPGFSYFSFVRVCADFATHRTPPRLAWSAGVMQHASAVRGLFRGELICLHLRNVAPFRVEESNADGSAWRAALRGSAKPGVRDFLLLGDDAVPLELQDMAGVQRAKDLGVDLATQLALVGLSDGFLGMASGLCTAANFSGTPHVIFKHPTHHAEQMRAELGEMERFPFATSQQLLWRRVADASCIQEALQRILP